MHLQLPHGNDIGKRFSHAQLSFCNICAQQKIVAVCMTLVGPSTTDHQKGKRRI
jgi:hypothetical protein